MSRFAKLSLLLAAAGMLAVSSHSGQAIGALEGQKYTYETVPREDNGWVYRGAGYFVPDGTFLVSIQGWNGSGQTDNVLHQPVEVSGEDGIQPGTWKEFRYRRYRFFNGVFDIQYNPSDIDTIDSYGAVPRNLERPIYGSTRQNGNFLLRWRADNVTNEDCNDLDYDVVHSLAPVCPAP